MESLERKIRSSELNSLKRILIDFKSLVNDTGEFVIYRTGSTIHYIFDMNGFFKVAKSSDSIQLEKFLDHEEYVKVTYADVKAITALKKSQVTDIRYDTLHYEFVTTIDEVDDYYVITKQKDTEGLMKNLVEMTSTDSIFREFSEVFYDVKNQMLSTVVGNYEFPYKITFSDDINFKLKIEEPNSKYYIRLLNEGAFVQVITKSEFKEIYEPQSMLFVFNYLNNREV